MSEAKVQKVISGSSTVARVDYDPLMENMTVYFKNSGVYTFNGVPRNVFDEMVEAESVGRYFVSNVKNRYDFLRNV